MLHLSPSAEWTLSCAQQQGSWWDEPPLPSPVSGLWFLGQAVHHVQCSSLLLSKGGKGREPGTGRELGWSGSGRVRGLMESDSTLSLWA